MTEACVQLLRLTGARSTVERVATYLDLEAVAELLGVDRRTAYALIRSGGLPGVKTNNGWYVEREDALRFMGPQ